MEKQTLNLNNFGPHIDSTEIPFTICFCRYVPENKILLIKRVKKPHQQKWNGLGGKLIPGETPDACVRREILEEAGIDLKSGVVHFAGLVSWSLHDAHDLDQITREVKGGMYAYVADFTDSSVLFSDRDTPEGLLSWKDFSFASDLSNAEMADNVPHFLPSMLSAENQNQKPKQYHCIFDNGKLISVTEHGFVSENQASEQEKNVKQITGSFEELVANKEKMIRRHPQLFTHEQKNVEEHLKTWEKIKAQERLDKEKKKFEKYIEK